MTYQKFNIAKELKLLASGKPTNMDTSFLAERSRKAREITMTDAIDELVARSKDHKKLWRFHKFHRAHPEVLGFLVDEIQLRVDKGFTAFSFASLYHYARWTIEMEKGPGDTFKMNDHCTPFYARAIVIQFPEFNGLCEFRKSTADICFGTELEPIPKPRPKNYARRLRWADGKAIENGWRPNIPYVPTRVARRKPSVHEPQRMEAVCPTK